MINELKKKAKIVRELINKESVEGHNQITNSKMLNMLSVAEGFKSYKEFTEQTEANKQIEDHFKKISIHSKKSMSEMFEEDFGFRKNNYSEHADVRNYTYMFAEEVNRLLSYYVDCQGFTLKVEAPEEESFKEQSMSSFMSYTRYNPFTVKSRLVYLSYPLQPSDYDSDAIEIPGEIRHDKVESYFNTLEMENENTVKFMSPLEVVNRILKYYGSFSMIKNKHTKEIKIDRELKYFEVFGKKHLAGSIHIISMEGLDKKIRLSFNLFNEKATKAIENIRAVIDKEATSDDGDVNLKHILKEKNVKEESLQYLLHEFFYKDEHGWGVELESVIENTYDYSLSEESTFIVENLVNFEILEAAEVKKDMFDACNDELKELEGNEEQLEWLISNLNDNQYDDTDDDTDEVYLDMENISTEKIIKEIGKMNFERIFSTLYELDIIDSRFSYIPYRNFINAMTLNESIVGTKRWKVLEETALEVEDVCPDGFDYENSNFKYCKFFWIAYLSEAMSVVMPDFCEVISEYAKQDIVLASLGKS